MGKYGLQEEERNYSLGTVILKPPNNSVSGQQNCIPHYGSQSSFFGVSKKPWICECILII